MDDIRLKSLVPQQGLPGGSNGLTVATWPGMHEHQLSKRFSRRSGLTVVFLACLVALLVVAACDSGGDNMNPDGSMNDAPGAVNALGQVCTLGASTGCPSDPAHLCTSLSSVGSQTQGYCTPLCTTEVECTTGYTGPATGQLACFPDQQNRNRCVIICGTKDDCPTGLDCLAPQGAPMAFCVVAP